MNGDDEVGVSMSITKQNIWRTSQKTWAMWTLSEGDIELIWEERNELRELTEDEKETIAEGLKDWVEEVLSLSDWNVALSDIIDDVVGSRGGD